MSFCEHGVEHANIAGVADAFSVPVVRHWESIRNLTWEHVRSVRLGSKATPLGVWLQGVTTWRAIGEGSPISLTWQWVCGSDETSILQIADMLSVESNLQLVDCKNGVTTTLDTLRRAVVLARAVVEIRSWQEKVVSSLGQ
jgi:hypothetical protein